MKHVQNNGRGKNKRHIVKIFLYMSLKVLALGHLVLITIILCLSLYVRYNNPSKTTLMLYRQYLFHHRILPVQFVPLERIPASFVSMVVAMEDYKFYSHHGIDFQMMKIAFFINRKVGYRMYGASTITMQLARTLFLFPEKYFVRKYVEVLLALGMELVLPKERILELYLNYCEMGRGVYGMPAASLHYFNRDLGLIGIEEQQRLITILPNPVDYNTNNFMRLRLLADRYYLLKFRYYAFRRFNGLR